MSKKILITEEEKNHIKKLHNIQEQSFIEKGIELALKKMFDKSDKTQPSSTETKTDTKPDEGVTVNGDVKIVGNFDAEQRKNINFLIDKMNEAGITNPYTQVGILSVINKECNFKPKSEVSYATTSNSRIRKIFGKRVAGYSDSELDALKRDQRKFFNVVYAKTVGNRGGEDGFLYRGRGFNQLTGIKNYEKYSKMIGMGDELVKNPDLVNDPEIAAKIAIAFFTKGKSASTFPNFTDKVEAAEYFADINAGGTVSSHRSNAVAKTQNFDINVA
jgi:predicted chitinase